MISNMQQQQFDSVIMDKILTENSGHYVNNNNNNNMDKNIHIIAAPSADVVIHNQNTADILIYDPNVVDYFDQSSLNAKEIVTVASQQSYESTPTIIATAPTTTTTTKNFDSAQYVIVEPHKPHNQQSSQEYASVNIEKDHTYMNVKEAHKKPQQRVSINNTSPMKSTNNHHNIEIVHNYSKLNRFDDSTNSSSPEDDDDEDDIDDDHSDEVFRTTSASKLSTKSQSSHPIQNIQPIVGIDYGDCCGYKMKLYQQSTVKGDDGVEETNVRTLIKSTSFSTAPITPTSDVADDDENCEKLTPDHHARRPMNAFLIFCKRHRAIVRDKYKHLENRAITKILGDWWATLDAEEKGCYTELAKEYKDAFFSANPNFKWYKLPAPPLRTLTTRPGNAERPLVVSNLTFSYTNDYDTIIGNKDAIHRTNYARSSTTTNHEYELLIQPMENNRSNGFQKSPSVGVFKLADETQMGSLNSLMCSSSCNPKSNGPASSDIYTNNDNNHRYDQVDQHQALQNALSETSSFMSNTMPATYRNDSIEPFQNMRDHAFRMKNDNVINGKRKSSDEYTWVIDEYKKRCISGDSGTGDIDSVPKKSARSCKGKKYLEFMSSGQITPFVKKTAPKSRTTPNFPHNGYCKNSDISSDHSDYHTQSFKPIKTENPIPDQYAVNNNHQPLGSPTSIKQFDASDFDLEEKIKALPAQSLEDYLLRKRETKKKKKIGSKRRTTSTSVGKLQNYRQPQPRTILEAREQIQMVGSQKRKARKESITRRDINTMNSSEQTTTGKTSNNSLFETVESLVHLGATIKTELDDEDVTIMQRQPSKAIGATSDLLILAEVAANHIVQDEDVIEIVYN